MPARFIVILALLLPAHSLHATRMITLYRQTLKIAADSARGINFRVVVSCENQSTVRQTLTIELLDANLTSAICTNASSLTGWRDTGHCWWGKELEFDQTEKTIIVPANGAGEVTFDKVCAFTPTGLDCDRVAELEKLMVPNWQFLPPLPGDGGRHTCTGVGTPCLRTGTGEFSMRIRAKVAEDRGAILCGSFANLSLPYSGEVPVQIVTPFNGGRAF